MTHLHAQPLEKTLRNALERAVSKARTVAEEAARQELTRLGVGEAKAPDFLTAEQRTLRTRLRALGRQLGDIKEANATQSIENLVTSVAYEHWHRMLFARYLEQNNLLMYDQYTALTLDECNELAQDPSLARDEQEKRCTNGWELAAVLASKMLPQIFRIDSPVFELAFAPALQRELTLLVNGLAPETFHASDSLGWVYQFWQADNKDRINQSEVKIGARELPAVTQLFTEPYMVSFLLDNALGAWWANQRLSEQDWLTAQSENELREKASIPGVPLTYLRFVQVEDSEQGSTEEGAKRWTPAAGIFDSWPNALSELKTLDPSCGSGHFLVATLLMLVPMRMALENLNAQQAIDAVLTENIHGLELDQRCVELAAFALALEAWRYPESGGYRALPELHLACSGLSVQAAKEEWKQLGLGKKNLGIALDWLHDSFQDAPVLGSLINPAKSKAANLVPWAELQQALNTALTQENDTSDGDSSDQQEAAVVAQGLAKAASLLSGQYSWVITNVPYLARGKQHDTLKDFCEQHYPEGKNDLATVFLDRCLELCHQGGTASIVLPQNWLFLTSYKKFREKLLKRDTWNLVARLGAGAFETISGEVVQAILLTICRGQQQEINEGLFAQTAEQNTHQLRGLDVSEPKTAEEKAQQLLVAEIKSVGQAQQLENPDARIALDEQISLPLLKEYAEGVVGLQTGDDPKYSALFWEIENINREVWELMQNTPEQLEPFSGLTGLVRWEKGEGDLLNSDGSRPTQGLKAVGCPAVSVHRMRVLFSYHFSMERLHQNVAIVLPKKKEYLLPIWCFCSSPEYNEAVRRIDQKLNVTNATLVKVPFDLDHWSKVAEEQYPHGLPQPYSNDPTQWIFHGHPCGSVIWSDTEKRTVEGDLRIDDTVLQVAVARLLGYRWPAELDPEMELAPEQRAWVERSQVLNRFEDDDGIVCLPAVRGEAAADQRLEAILEAAYSEQGGQWTVATRDALLKLVGGKSLAHWLRDKFFEQHCKLFQHRPFIWHIWDGLNDGFSVLVNYHKFNKAGLERLIYTYLSDWITTQQAGLQSGTDGAQERLAAAQTLKKELEAILKGEKPYDIFVRWKPLTEQPIGWNPDLNDGIRLNIRPFMLAKDLGKKDAGILRAKPNIHWQKDRGTDVATAPWYKLGLEYGGKEGDRINEHHLSLEEKQRDREC